MSSNPYLQRQAKRGAIGHGRLSERRVTKQLGGRLHAASGALEGQKSDASLPESGFRCEMKSTTSKSIAIQQEWLVKITNEALDHAQHPAVVVSFVTPEGKPAMKHHADWVMIPREVFKELLDK